MVKLALEGLIEKIEDESIFGAGGLFEPFGMNALDAVALLPKAISECRTAVNCELNPSLQDRALELPASEPEAMLLSWRGSRSGLMMAAAVRGDKNELIALWPYTTDGVEHELHLERVLVPSNRVQGLLEGTVFDLPICFMDIFYAADRVFHRIGSVHQVLLAGIAHEFSVIDSKPIKLEPTRVSYDLRRVFGSEAVNADGSVTLQTRGMAAMATATEQCPSNWYHVQGPVRRIERYSGDLFGRAVWTIRTTVSRGVLVGDRDFNIDIFLTDHVLNNRPLPAVGDDIHALIWLQGRIWWPNIDEDPPG
jgi:hypothetical protein